VVRRQTRAARSHRHRDEQPRRAPNFAETLIGKRIARDNTMFLPQEKSPGYYLLVPAKDATSPE
jgi:hypothetical protein